MQSVLCEFIVRQYNQDYHHFICIHRQSFGVLVGV